MYTWPQKYMHYISGIVRKWKDNVRRADRLTGKYYEPLWHREFTAAFSHSPFISHLSLCLVLLSTDTYFKLSVGWNVLVTWEAISQLTVWTTSAPETSLQHTGAGLLCAHRHTHITRHGEALQLVFWSRMWHFIIMAVTCWVPSSYCQWCGKQHITLCNSKSHKAMTGTALLDRQRYR